MVSGIPLSDGSKVWRTYGVPLPEVVQLVARDAGTIWAWFATDVWVEEGFTPDDVIQIDQGTCVPESHGADYAYGFNYFELACTPLDWSVPITFEMGHVRSRAGLVMTPVTREVTFSFAPGEMFGVRFPLSISAPLVPAALCAGVSCE